MTFVMDNSGKVWLIHLRHYFSKYFTLYCTLWWFLAIKDIYIHIYRLRVKFTEDACVYFLLLWRMYIMPSWLDTWFNCVKRVIQDSTASSHLVGECLFVPSKQSRIRRSSFWSRRRSTVQWETALSSKERSRRVTCPMTVPDTKYQGILFFVARFIQW